MISGSMEDLLVSWWSLVGGLWVDGGPAGESVVGGRWVVGALVGGSVVCVSVEDLLVGRWSVLGGRWPVGVHWFCITPDYIYLLSLF